MLLPTARSIVEKTQISIQLVWSACASKSSMIDNVNILYKSGIDRVNVTIASILSSFNQCLRESSTIGSNIKPAKYITQLMYDIDNH